MNLEEKKINKWTYFSFILLFVISAVVLTLCSINGGALDLGLSKAVVRIPVGTRSASTWLGTSFEIFGAYPICIIGCFVLLLLEYVFRVKGYGGKLNMALRVLIIAVSIGVAIYCTHDVLKFAYFIQNDKYDSLWSGLFSFSLLITIPISLILNVALYYMIAKMALDPDKVLRFVIVGLIGIIVSFVIVHVLKAVMPRERYRAIWFLNGGDFANYFTPWYKPGTILDLPMAVKDDFASFPSGHTQAASTLFIFMLMPYYFKEFNTKTAQIKCFGIAFLVVIITAFSRVIEGAHFLSDVSMGLFITSLSIFIPFVIERSLYYKKLENLGA